ncbi:MAG TPA: L-histidine N(alpha)-methyltransferase [Gemmatimonadaceae bacterium]|nr:L-histidine N(alpha)-methyltransferase [Gemmatimonadaceae bacterium]
MPSEYPVDSGVAARLLDDVRRGFGLPQKQLPSDWLYDDVGSSLYEEITQLPEYYLACAEMELLRHGVAEVLRQLRCEALVELGPGSGEKAALLVAQIARANGGKLPLYVPVDASPSYLARASARLKEQFDSLVVETVAARFGPEVLQHIPRKARPLLVAFLGSTIGNLEDGDAVALLAGIAGAMLDDDRLLVGADLHTKPRSWLLRAYNDARGVTARFNKNVLAVLNRELGAAFPLQSFAHRAPWVEDVLRIEMHLVAQHDLDVRVPGAGVYRFRAGESIRTEICRKFSLHHLERLLTRAGLVVERFLVNARYQYALVLAARA